jgi:glycosyltransferase involved in cell wall biosynthesis
MPCVSVIVPTHSRPNLLPRAVESARLAGSDVEIIVVDDASTDATAEVCSGLTGIKYIRLDRNQGVAGARNVGILASSGDYIAFLDDDDLRLPGSLDVQREALESNPLAGFVCGAMLLADQHYEPTGEVSAPNHPGGDAFWELLELDFPVMPLCVLIRKTCFLKVGLLRPHLHGIDDWDILVRIAELYPVVVLSEPMGLYRKPTPLSGQGSSAQDTQLRRAARQQLELFRLPRVVAASKEKRREVRRRTLNRIADTLLWSAIRELRQGNWSAARANTLSALISSPLRIARPAAYKRLASTFFEEASRRKAIDQESP